MSDLQDWDICDEHEQTFPRHDECAYCKADRLAEPCKHVFRNVTGQPWLKCMECGVVVDE
jgi:hypothetical protein